MFNREKANTPAPMNIMRPNKTIGRRVNPKVKSPLSTASSPCVPRDARREGLEPQARQVAAFYTDGRRYLSSLGPSATRCLDISWSTTPCQASQGPRVGEMSGYQSLMAIQLPERAG